MTIEEPSRSAAAPVARDTQEAGLTVLDPPECICPCERGEGL